MTRVINLFGGPGTGKSTSAAYIFALLKMRGINAELVREYAKEFAWRGEKITAEMQQAIFETQLCRESTLYGKVDVIVTDSPLELCAYYTRRYGSGFDELLMNDAVRTARSDARRAGVAFFDAWLTRSKIYNPAGRYETEAQAREIDVEQRGFVEGFIGSRVPSYETDEAALRDLSYWATARNDGAFRVTRVVS